MAFLPQSPQSTIQATHHYEGVAAGVGTTKGGALGRDNTLGLGRDEIARRIDAVHARIAAEQRRRGNAETDITRLRQSLLPAREPAARDADAGPVSGRRARMLPAGAKRHPPLPLDGVPAVTLAPDHSVSLHMPPMARMMREGPRQRLHRLQAQESVGVLEAQAAGGGAAKHAPTAAAMGKMPHGHYDTVSTYVARYAAPQ
jgi:hypothetical protein